MATEALTPGPVVPDDLPAETENVQAAGLARCGITTRAVVIALVFTWLAGYWVRQSEIVALACQGTEAVPSIPGVGALILILIGNAFARRTRLARPLQMPEIITIFLSVTVATTMLGCGIGRFLLACLSAPFYYSTPAAPLEKLATFIPPWMSPADPLVHRWLYEGTPTGGVPWGAWQWPIVAWTGFFVMFGGMLLSLMALFSKRWGDQERLVFPLVRLPLQMIDPEYSKVPFFKSKAAWIGIGLALALNAINMVRGVFMGGPNGGLHVDLGASLVGAPWSAMRPLNVHLRPELIGLGYLISTELSFSIWFFHALSKLQALMISGVMGLRLPGAPFAQEQGIGAYAVLGAILFWKGRGPILDGVHALLHGAKAARSPDAAACRWPALGAVLGFIGAVVFCRAAGMSLWLTLVYLGLLTSVSVVYA
ncbi:MAG TPA: DUF6785 family protein, partial [Armatimonadota bacterium]|nr:DUF6785 family protein [Armatimonadota bacterium]